MSQKQVFEGHPGHLARLKQGVDVWNAWRRENPNTKPELRGADLEGADLKYVNLERANLERANLRAASLGWAHLEGAGLLSAHLEDASVFDAHLENAWLGHAHLEGADLSFAHLEGALLGEAHLDGADLRCARLRGASLEGANLARADLSDTELEGTKLDGARCDRTIFEGAHWRNTDGSLPDPANYTGFDVRGIRSSDPLFDQFVRQSNFIHACSESWPKWLFWLWKTTCDCGRSLPRWLASCGVVMVFFALVFICGQMLGYELVETGRRSTETWFSPFYFSAVTFSTLGFGDVTPCNVLGQIIVVIEVFLGYAFLGGAISIFTTKFIPPR
jgi:hypothetical protein